MREMFFGYYSPTQDEYARLWQEGLIVLDTNVLLDLYRLPKEARDEFFDVLNALKKRVWLPYQVALEFQRRRLTVIGAERKGTEAALQLTSELVDQVKDKVTCLQMEKHALGIDPKPLLDDLESANGKVIEAIQKVHAAQLDVTAQDPIRERLDKIIGKNIGSAPVSRADLDALIAQGNERYEAKIPPGFSDVSKDKNPNEAELVHDGLVYERKFGDLILWRQLLDYAKSKKTKCVLFVTSDKKEDWWWKEQGKTVGPHPELIREIMRLADVELFWMYSSVQFLEYASKHTQTKVSDKSVADLQGVVTSGSVKHHAVDALHALRTYRDEDAAKYYVNYEEVEFGVLGWLERLYDAVVTTSSKFPDFIVHQGNQQLGFETKYTHNFNDGLFTPGMINSMLRGYIEIKEGRLAEFTLVIVIRRAEYVSIKLSDKVDQIRTKMRNLLKKYPITSIVVGTIGDDQIFEPLIGQSRAPF